MAWWLSLYDLHSIVVRLAKILQLQTVPDHAGNSKYSVNMQRYAWHLTRRHYWHRRAPAHSVPFDLVHSQLEEHSSLPHGVRSLGRPLGNQQEPKEHRTEHSGEVRSGRPQRCDRVSRVSQGGRGGRLDAWKACIVVGRG